MDKPAMLVIVCISHLGDFFPPRCLSESQFVMGNILKTFKCQIWEDDLSSFFYMIYYRHILICCLQQNYRHMPFKHKNSGEKILIFRNHLNGHHPICQQADEEVGGRGSGKAVSLCETNPGRLGLSSKELSIQCKYGQSTRRAGGKGGYRALCLATMVH